MQTQTKNSLCRSIQLLILASTAVITFIPSIPGFSQENRGADRYGNATAPSYVFERGNVEIVTYETEQAYDKLQTLFKDSEMAGPAPGELVNRYYRSHIDGSVQPYSIWLPRDYSTEKSYPLVIQLHGTNFKEVLSGSRLNPRGMGISQWVISSLPVICVHCSGGPTTFYQGIGEIDILRVIEEVKRLHPIDPDRVFIMGHSMGGAGSFTVGLHHPDQFGGIMAFDPAMGQRATVLPSNIPAWMQPQIDIVTPAKLYPNGRNVDVFFKNAGAGIQRINREYSDGIVEQGGFATTEVLPGLPHSFGTLYPNANWITELIAHPIRRKPTEVKFYTNTLQFNSAYWVTIDRLQHHNADSRITATCDETSVNVTTTNLDAISLRLSDAPAPKGFSAKLIVDGREVMTGTLPSVAHLNLIDGEWKIGASKAVGLAKRHGLQGPIGDAFNSRFLAVYGSTDRELAIAELDAIRNPPGPFDIHGDFPMKADSKVTPGDIQSSNLILFGTPESNSVLNRLAPSLPTEAMKTGGVFIYPNPESPEHYIVVWSSKLLSLPDHGLRGGWIMPLNLLPDFVQVNDGKIVSGGHFDGDWKYPPVQSNAIESRVIVAQDSAVKPPEMTKQSVQPTSPNNPSNQQPAPFGGARPSLLTDAQRKAQQQALNQNESARLTEKLREADRALREAILAQPCDPTVLRDKAEALANLQAEQTVQRLSTIATIATTLTAEQREQIQNFPPGALSFILTGFANPNNAAGGGRFQKNNQPGQRPFSGQNQPNRSRGQLPITTP